MGPRARSFAACSTWAVERVPERTADAARSTPSAASFLGAVGLVDFDPPDELSDPPSLADRVFLPMALGSLPPLVAVGRALVRWQYVDSRLAEDTLYFERTGWNDGFMARKDPDAAKRDAQARAAQTGPQLAILRCPLAAASALSTGFVF